MDEGRDRSLLARMVVRPRPEAEAAAPATPARALRIALTRAAERAVGLTTTALGVSDDTLPLADLLARIEEGWLLLRMEGTGEPGLFALCPGFLSAVSEMQMRGRISESEPDRRPPTTADAALAEPLVRAFLSELALAAEGTPLDGWASGRVASGRFTDLRAAGMALPETDFRTVSLSAWLGAGDRQGQILLALPLPPRPSGIPDPAERAAAWSVALHDNVLGAQAVLEAVLHRMRLPLGVVQRFEVGQNLPLPGVRLGAIRLEGPGREVVARGRLGQSCGLRAVRIKAEAPPQMGEARLKVGVNRG